MKKQHLIAPIGLASLLVFANPASAVVYVWTNGGGDNDYNTDANWDQGTAPVAGRNQAHFNSFGAELSSGSPAGISAIRIGYDGTDGDFTQSGGTLNVTNNSNDASRVGRNAADGTWNMTGGTATINAIQVGLNGGGNTSVGTMNVSGGSLTISRGVAGASLAVGFGGVGNFTLSGNAIFQSRNVVTVGMSGTGSGTFNVIGSSVGGGPTAGTIGIGTAGTTDGIWNQGANGTLNMTIDASGVSTLFIDDKAQGDVAANFALGSLLGLDFNVAPYDGSFTLMEVENGDVTDSGLALTGSTDPNWSFAVDNSGANGLLIGTYLSVPEPGSISLLFASLGTLLVRRRR